MEDDEDYVNNRAAPTRERRFIKEPFVPGLEPNADANAAEVLQKLTGKRFSITELLKRKSKKDGSNKEETNEEANTETKKKQDESKDS